MLEHGAHAATALGSFCGGGGLGLTEFGQVEDLHLLGISLIGGGSRHIGIGEGGLLGCGGGGGLGVIAINYGYHRYRSDVMLVTIILLVVIVQILQWIGTSLANRLDKKRL